MYCHAVLTGSTVFFYICCLYTVLFCVHIVVILTNIYACYLYYYCCVLVALYCFYVLYCFHVCIVCVHVLHWGQGEYTLFQQELGKNNTVFLYFIYIYQIC